MIFFVIFMGTDIMALVQQFTACIVLTMVQTAVGRWR